MRQRKASSKLSQFQAFIQLTCLLLFSISPVVGLTCLVGIRKLDDDASTINKKYSQLKVTETDESWFFLGRNLFTFLRSKVKRNKQILVILK